MVVAGKHSGQQRQNQADRAQDEVQDLQRRTGRGFIGVRYLPAFILFCFHAVNVAVDPLSCLIINPRRQNGSLETDWLARGGCQVKKITHGS